MIASKLIKFVLVLALGVSGFCSIGYANDCPNLCDDERKCKEVCQEVRNGKEKICQEKYGGLGSQAGYNMCMEPVNRERDRCFEFCKCFDRGLPMACVKSKKHKRAIQNDKINSPTMTE